MIAYDDAPIGEPCGNCGEMDFSCRCGEDEDDPDEHVCPDCHGDGTSWDGLSECRTCFGDGYL
jgi:hypothetical protein